jgi:hypothetical protein
MLAVSQAAKIVVLLGNPRQLDQPAVASSSVEESDVIAEIVLALQRKGFTIAANSNIDSFS